MPAIDICNAALAKNHHHDKIPPSADLTNPVGKAQVVCAEFYDQARRAAFRLANWTCIIKRAVLRSGRWQAETEYQVGDRVVEAGAVFACTVAGTTDTDAPGWPGTGTVTDGTVTWEFMYDTLAPLPEENLTQYAYAYAVPKDYINQVELQDALGVPVDFEMERGVIYANAIEPILRYVPDEPDDTMWDPLLREVVVTQLASMIAYPLTGSHENEVAFSQAAMGMARAATKKTRREQRQGPPPGNQWMDGTFGDRYR